MARRQINSSAKQRQEVVLRLLRGEAKAGELAREYTISEPTVYKWRDLFLEGGLSNLDGQRGEQAKRREFDQNWPNVIR